MPKIKAVILVGGLGTRLRPLTNFIPKSVVPVLNRPFMEHTFAYLKSHGIEDIILTVNYLPEIISKHFGDGSDYGVKLSYCYEAEPMGTAGAVKNAQEHLDTTFLVLNGDVFTDLDLSDLLTCHAENCSKITISLQWVENPSAFGVVETDTDDRVLAFIEKPPPGEETTNWINAGIYVIEPDILKYIPENSHYMFEKGLFPLIVDKGEPVYGYEFRGYWMDTGTLYLYRTLSRDLLSGKTCSPLISNLNDTGITVGKNVKINSSAVIMPPVLIGDNCTVEPDVSIKGPVVVGNHCVIESHAYLNDSIIWSDVRIGEKSSLSGSIISNDVVIETGENITNLVVTPDDRKPI